MSDEITNDIGRKTKESLIWSTCLPAVFQVLRFVISIVIARILDPEDFGIMGIASIIIFYTDSFSNFGFSTALIQRKSITKEHINSVFTINLCISICLVLLTCLLSGKVAFFFKVPELRDVFLVMSCIFIITTFYTIPITLLRRDLNFKNISKIEFVKGISQSLISLLLAMLGFKFWSLVVGLIVGLILATIIILQTAKWKPKIIIDMAAIRDIGSFAGWAFISSQIRLLSDYVDKLLIGKFLGTIPLGYYDKASSISMMPLENVSNKISGVMFSTFSRTQGNVYELKEYFAKSLVTISVVCFPIFIGLMLVSEYFVVSLFGEKWVPMVMSFRILLTSYMVYSVTSIVNAINVSVGKYRQQVIARMFCLVILLISCMIVIERGIEYIAAALLLYNLIFLLMSYKITMNHLSLKWHFMLGTIWPAMSASLAMSLVLYLVIRFLPETSMSNLCILLSLGFAIYVLFILIFDIKQIRFLKKEFISRISFL